MENYQIENLDKNNKEIKVDEYKKILQLKNFL